MPEEFSPFAYQPLQVVRVNAILLPASAWDVAPLEFDCPYAGSVTLFVAYIRGGAAGAMDMQIEVSPYTADVTAPAPSWFTQSLYEPVNVVAGTDANSIIQRELVTYTAIGAALETFVYQVGVAEDIQRVRVGCRESGNVGAPGTCLLIGMLK